jgi:hypothetical protein
MFAAQSCVLAARRCGLRVQPPSNEARGPPAIRPGHGASRCSSLLTCHVEALCWRVTWRRLGVLAAEGAASLKLIDKGVAKEALAFLVLFQARGLRAHAGACWAGADV